MTRLLALALLAIPLQAQAAPTAPRVELPPGSQIGRRAVTDVKPSCIIMSADSQIGRRATGCEPVLTLTRRRPKG